MCTDILVKDVNNKFIVNGRSQEFSAEMHSTIVARNAKVMVTISGENLCQYFGKEKVDLGVAK